MNITEFAHIAGVSKAAVSRFFNDGYLSDEKYERIARAVEETGYAPSAQAQTLRTRRTRQVGVILPKLSGESTARVVEGISRVLDAQDYLLLLANTYNDPQREVRYLELFRENHVDGIIFLASIFTPAHEEVLQNIRIPLVIVGQQYPGAHCVYHDDYGTAYALTELLLARGCRRPAYIGVTIEDRAAGQARREGFVHALAAHDLNPNPNLMRVSKFHMDAGYDQMQLLLEKGLHPDGLLCATDNIAMGAMQCCREHCVRIPQDMLLAAVGDNDLGRVCATPLTSAHLHYHTSGEQAATTLLHLLRKDKGATDSTELPFEIVERASTSPKTETI